MQMNKSVVYKLGQSSRIVTREQVIPHQLFPVYTSGSQGEEEAGADPPEVSLLLPTSRDRPRKSYWKGMGGEATVFISTNRTETLT